MGLKERLGFVPRSLTRQVRGSPRIWIHGVSLGEVRVAASLIAAIQKRIPGCTVLLSTTTEHGRKLATQTFQEDIPVLFAPIDTVFAVKKALSRVRPHVMVFLETEIWPTWLSEANKMGARIALVNGRISTRSLGHYLRFRFFFREVLKNVHAFSMISKGDADRIKAMGADPQKVKINGNAKYDLLAAEVDPGMEKKIRKMLNLQNSHTVFIAGSTRAGEEAIVLDAYEKIRERFPQTILILAPRHIVRVSDIGALLGKRGLSYQVWSQLRGGQSKRTGPVVIIDTFGDLFDLYSVATVVFCGASLVPLGGQNPLEPAAWGKMVLYGPSMEDFIDAKALLEEIGAGITVSNSDMLAERAIWLFDHPHELETCGARAQAAIINHRGAAERHAEVIANLL